MAELKNNKIRLQFQPECSESVHHLFVIQTEGRLRDSLSEHLLENGVQTGMHYPVPCHLQPAYAHLGYTRGDFPNAEKLADGCLSLPLFPGLKDEQLSKVIDAVNAY